MNIILFFLFAAICKLCRVLLSSPDLTPRTQKTETVADEPLAEAEESTGSETVSRRKKPYIYKYIKFIATSCAVAGNADG